MHTILAAARLAIKMTWPDAYGGEELGDARSTHRLA
jgi:hypothetical protein